MKISYLIGGFPVLSEHALLDEMAAVRDLGAAVRVEALFPTGQTPPPEFEGLAGDVRFLRAPAALDLHLTAFDFIKRQRLRRHLEADRPDVLHAQFGHLGLLAAPVARKLGLPLALSFRGQDVMIVADQLSERARRRLFDQCVSVLARAEAMRADLQKLGCPADKLVVLPSGIRVEAIPFRERTPPASEEAITILAVGRLVSKKGMADAVRTLAFGWPGPTGPRLRIIGVGPDRWMIEEAVRQGNLGKRVALLGALPHARVIEEMLAADLFLLPCRTGYDGDREGIPNAIKEAMATGLPVVSTLHAGIPECVEHGVSGLLAGEGDTEQLLSCLDEMIDNPGRWAEMGRRGREIVQEKFDLKKLAPRLMELYHTVAGREAVNTSPGTRVPSA